MMLLVVWIVAIVGWAGLAIVVQRSHRKERERAASRAQEIHESEQEQCLSRAAAQAAYRKLSAECEAIDQHCEFLAKHLLELLNDIARSNPEEIKAIENQIWSVSGSISVIRTKRLARQQKLRSRSTSHVV